MSRVSTGTATVANGETLVTAWVGAGGVVLSEITAPIDSPVVIEGVANFIASRVSTTSFELALPHAGAGGADLSCAISAMTAAETQIGTLNARTARVIQGLRVQDANGHGLTYNLIGVTGAGDPGQGAMAFNSADPELITEVYLDVLDDNEGGRDVSSLIDLWQPGTVLIVRSLETSAFYSLQLTQAPIVLSGWRRVSVDYIGSSGMLANEAVGIEWRISGAGLAIDADGTFSERAAYNGEAAGFIYASSDGDGDTLTTSVLFRKRGAGDNWGPALALQGVKGDKGDKGWVQVFGTVVDGARRVEQLVGYVGGEGAAPTADIGKYRGAAGLVVDIADATDVRGATGATGDISGLTSFWNSRVTTDANAAAARIGLGTDVLGGIRNKLVNALGTINQRGYVSGAATGSANKPTLDRWRVVTSGQSLSWTESEGVRTMTAPAGGVEQVVEGSNILTGSYVLSWEGTATATVNGTARTSGETFVLTGGADVTVKFSGGTFEKPQLEVGTSPTVFAAPDFQQELARCQRDCEKSYGLTTAPGTASSVGAFVAQPNGTVRYRGQVGFSVRKRTENPTISLYSTYTGAAGNAYNASSTADLAIGTVATGGSGFVVEGNATVNTTDRILFQWFAETGF